MPVPSLYLQPVVTWPGPCFTVENTVTSRLITSPVVVFEFPPSPTAGGALMVGPESILGGKNSNGLSCFRVTSGLAIRISGGL